MSKDGYLYVERQSLHPIAVGAAILIGVAGLVGLIPITNAELPASQRAIPGVVALGVSLFILNVLPMKTSVDRHEVRVRFGRLFPMYVERIAIANVAALRPVEYRPIRDAGGWGIRWGRFEAKRARYLNARGHRGVLIEGEKLRLVIGSADPDKLASAIEQAKAG
jgi:hypothetical protein